MILLTATLIIATTWAIAQQPAAGSNPVAPSPGRLARAAFAENKQSGYLRAVLDLRAREREIDKNNSARSGCIDVLCWYLVMTGAHRDAFELEDEYLDLLNIPRPDRGDIPTLAGFTAKPAKDAILAAAAKQRIVMFNEEHRSTVQRAFLNEMLEGLRAAGFTHLALEALGSEEAGINARGYPVLASGLYTRDPAFGDLVRRAIAVGFKVVAYEGAIPAVVPADPVERENQREEAAAENLAALIKADGNHRLVVYAGRAHVCKEPQEGWIPMAARVAQKTGIDPLVFNLEKMVEHSQREREYGAYLAADQKGLLAQGPIVLLNEEQQFRASEKGYDADVFFPRATWTNGRPSYLLMAGLRRRTHIELKVSLTEPALLQARVPGESADAVPIDQIIVGAGETKPTLLLRPGTYDIVLIDRNDRALQREVVTVE